MNLIPRKRTIDGGFGTLQRQMNRLFDEFLTGFDLQPTEAFGEWAPSIDIAETDNEVVVKTELPGLDPKDVEVTMAGDTLTIKGEKKTEHEEKGRTWHRTERTYGTFQRSFVLPCAVDGDRVKAEFKNGVLTIGIPKREEARTKPIKVTVK
jgi:HSP20 family protein